MTYCDNDDVENKFLLITGLDDRPLWSQDSWFRSDLRQGDFVDLVQR